MSFVPNEHSKAQAYDDLALTPEEVATLAGLRDGSLVAVPRPVFPPRFWSSGVGPNGIRYFAVEWPLATKTARDDMLAAAAAPKGGEK